MLDRGFGKTFKDKIFIGKKLNLRNFIDESWDNEKNNANYNLISVSAHSGKSSSRGHYISRCYADDQKLYCFNDNDVEPINEEELFDNDPYILFYRKNSDDSNLKENNDSEEESKSDVDDESEINDENDNEKNKLKNVKNENKSRNNDSTYYNPKINRNKRKKRQKIKLNIIDQEKIEINILNC